MSILNYLLQLNAYSDTKASNSPNLQNFKWLRAINGITVENPVSQTVTVPADDSVTVMTAGEAKFLYVEASAEVTLTLNGEDIVIKPVVIGSTTYPGQFLVTAAITDIVFANADADDDLQVFIAYHN